MSKHNTTIRTLFGGIGPVSALFLLLSNFASRECAGGTINWVGSSGDWNSASNWSGGAVPGASDDVVIDTSNGSITVTMSSGSNAINSLNCQETLQLNGGILAVTTTAQVSGELNLDGGTIQGGTMLIADGASLVIGSSGALVGGVTVNGVLDVGNSVSGANLAVYGGLTLNGTMLVGNANQSYGGVNFEGSQLLGGNGTVVFGDSGYDALGLGSANTTLVIGPAITVHGQYGEIGAMSSYPWYGPQNVAVVNQGTISSDGGSGYVITVTGTNFNNAGTLEAQNGATLNIQDMAGNLGQVSLGANRSLGLNGNYTNNLDLTVGTNATLNLSGNWSNPGTINAPGGALNFSGNWINGGQIQINGATASLGGGWVNTGQIDATGGSLTLGASWTTNVNNGIIQAQSGTLDLEGTFTLAMFKFLEVGSGETMNIVGQLDNTNTTLVIDGALGSWVLAGGSIAGGSVLTTNNGALVIGSSGALVGGVTVNGVLDVGNSVSGANLAVYGGLTLNGTMLVGNANQSYGGVNFEGSQLLGGNGTVVFGDSGYDALGLGSANTTLVIGPAITVHGQYGEIGAMSSYPWYGPQNVAVVNQGTISSDGGSGYVITVTGTNFNNAGTLEAQNGATLNIQDMAGNIGEISIGATSTLDLNGTYTNNLGLTVGTNATLNLAGAWSNPGNINASGGTLNFTGNWINSGQIQINDGVASLEGGWVNTGQIAATGGTELTLGAGWTTNVGIGVIQAANSGVNLQGIFTLAMLKSLQVGNGASSYIDILGQLNNTNTTLVADGSVGTWYLEGGTINGGTIVTTNGAALIVWQSGTMNGVTVDGTLDVGNSSSGTGLNVGNGLTLNGTMLVGNPTNDYWGGVVFSGSQLLGGNGTVVFGNNGSQGAVGAYVNALTLAEAGTTLVIGPGITIGGTFGTVGYAPTWWNGSANVSVVNQGTIAADVASGAISITGQSFNNAGMLEALNGATLNIQDMAGNIGEISIGAASTLDLNGTYTNNLGLTVGTNATLNLAGAWSNPGNINASGGTLNFTGNWINSGQIQINDGVASLEGGWVNTGQIAATGGTELTLGAGWTTNVGIGVIQAANSGVNLQGIFTLAMLKSLQVGNGASSYIDILGQLNNTNTTLVADGSVGTWYLEGGTINGGTIVTTNGAALIVWQSGTMNGVTVDGTLDVGNSSSGTGLNVGNGLTLNGTMLVGNPTNDYWGGVVFSGSQLLGGNGTVVFGNNGSQGAVGAYVNALTLAEAGTTLVIGPGITIGGTFGTVGYAPTWWNGSANVSVVNQGTIAADVASGAISITGQSFNNAGMLEAQNGATLNIQDMAGNIGEISIGATSTLDLNGTYTNNLGLTVGTNATLNLAGAWSNLGNINASGGTLNFTGNWINSGQIQINDGVASLEGGWVNTGQIAATGGTELTLGAGWTTNVGIGVIQAANSGVNLQGIFTLAMLKSLQVGNGASSYIDILGQLNNTNTTLVADGSVGTWYLEGGTINGGTIVTTNGAALIVWQSGTMNGVTVDGTLDVGNSSSGTGLNVGNGLTLNGTMLVGNPTNDYWGGVVFSGSQLLGGNGTVVFGNNGSQGAVGAYVNALTLAETGTTLVIGPGITIGGTFGTVGYAPTWWNGSANVSVVNQGTIAADVASGAISITGQSFNNTGMLEAQNGGAVQVSSTATTNTGTIDVETGTITFPNIFTQTSGTLAFGLNSATDFGQMAFTGLATLGGTLAAHINGYFEAQIGDSFPVLNFGGSSPSITNFNLPTASYVWTNTATNGLLTIAVTGILPTSVSVSPTNSVVPVGSTVTFQANATGPGPLSIQWRLDGANLPGATNTILMLTNVSKSESGTYTVQVSNTGASLISGPAQLLVLAPPAIVVTPQSQTATIGTAATFAGTVSGDSPLSYQWVFNGASLAGATNPALTLSDVTRAEGGSYVLLVANPVGMATSAPPAVLTVASSVVCPSAPGGMVAWWRGDGDTSDYAGTNDAVFEGPAAYAPGEVGEAFSFNGFSSYMAAPDSPLWNFGTNDFSIELWANFNAVHPSIAAGDESVTFVAHDDPTGTDNKWIFGFGGGELYLYINDAQLGPQFLAQAAVNLNSNQWHHLGLTKGMGVYHIYVDGAAVSSTTNNVAIPAVSAPLTIGQADDFLMDGLLDEISIYKRALVPAEMQAIYLNGSQGKCGSSQSVTVGQPGFNSNGQFQFQILGGVVGKTIYVQASSNLANWVTIWQVVKTQNLEIFTDTNSTSNGSQFYRSSLNP